jgi:hypothetical protein
MELHHERHWAPRARAISSFRRRQERGAPWVGAARHCSPRNRMPRTELILYPPTLTALSSLAWPFVPLSAQPDCLFTVYRRTGTYSPKVPNVG